ncbi:MAG: hypothetical protein A3D65_05205 [Candidatus Lloydbacteria bacterium RIFCSPHIGHO2_02_FULL_50_13]|uniref:LemA family protein n=1 Tax=Candidatus Lloydbacteria bacterium RIFCSPHIGHO2_02_FULL_50_13 TaxID=1798661 RepID=A0A1G2D129_9BACT|nr:MAG: hypothetical protein A3D65_05205 [Candidatus Lloydbacteria bacterium RIFCSPHIGHO2_02_FULL_50_13]
MGKLITLGIVGVVALVLVSMFIGTYNYGNSTEVALKATKKNNENILAQYSQKVREAAQVPDMYVEGLTKITREAMTGRYGAEGSKAVFQWIKEQNPNVDPQVYIKLQQIVESGRDQFQVGQTRLIDQRRGYEESLGSFPRGIVLSILGYPRINLDDFNIVTNEYASDAFEKGKEEGPLKLR